MLSGIPGWDPANSGTLQQRGIGGRRRRPVTSISVSSQGSRSTATSWTVEIHDGETAYRGRRVLDHAAAVTGRGLGARAADSAIREITAGLRHRCGADHGRCRPSEPAATSPTTGCTRLARNFQVGRIQNYGRWSPALAPDGWHGTYLGFDRYPLPGAIRGFLPTLHPVQIHIVVPTWISASLSLCLLFQLMKSSGSGASIFKGSPLIGCTNANDSQCRACRSMSR